MWLNSGMYFLLLRALELRTYDFSLLWLFIIIVFHFVVWRTSNFVINTWTTPTQNGIHGKKSETVEWFNFLLYRWCRVFSSDNLDKKLKKRIDAILATVKPNSLAYLELKTVKFGEQTPTVKYVRVIDRSESSPTAFEIDIDTRCYGSKIVFSARAVFVRHFDVEISNLRITGKLRVLLQMSKNSPFPHVSKATVYFTESPNVQFGLWCNSKILRFFNICSESQIQSKVMEGLKSAMVHPNHLNIPFS